MAKEKEEEERRERTRGDGGREGEPGRVVVRM